MQRMQAVSSAEPELVSRARPTCESGLALFPAPAQLSVACSCTASDGKLGGAWERGLACETKPELSKLKGRASGNGMASTAMAAPVF